MLEFSIAGKNQIKVQDLRLSYESTAARTNL